MTGGRRRGTRNEGNDEREEGEMQEAGGREGNGQIDAVKWKGKNAMWKWKRKRQRGRGEWEEKRRGK